MVIYFAKLVKKNSILFVFSGFSHTLLPMISLLSATAAASIAAAGGVGPAACGSPVASPGGLYRRPCRRRSSIGWLVSFGTWARAYCYVPSCHTIRALVSSVTSRQWWSPRGARRLGSSPSASVDIHIGRYRHRHRPVCIAPDGLHVAARGGGASICLRPFSCVPQPLRERHNCLCRGKKSAFCLVLSPTWTTFAPY